MNRKISRVFKDFLRKEIVFNACSLSLIACKEDEIFYKFLKVVEGNRLKTLFDNQNAIGVFFILRKLFWLRQNEL